MTILSRLKRSGVNAEAGNRPYVSGDDYPTQMRKRTQKAVDDISPQVQSELVRPYKQPSYEAHEYYKVPPPGIDLWEPPVFDPIPLPEFRVPTPLFFPLAGAWPSGQEVSILCSLAGAQIYYSTNGKDPDKHSIKYVAPITLSGTLNIKAIAFRDKWETSKISEAKYITVSGWELSKNIRDASADDWQRYIYAIGYDSTNNVLIVGTQDIISDQAEIWRSTNSGDTWTLELKSADGFDLFWKILHDPINNVNLAFGGNPPIVYRSTDAGDSWANAFDMSDTTADTHIYSACHAYTSDILVCGSANGRIWRSSDAGATWSHDATLPGLVRSMAYDVNNDIIYAISWSSSGSSIYKSTDSGASWTGPTAMGRACSIFYEQINDIWLVGESYNTKPVRIFRSDNSGASWDTVHTFNDNKMIRGFAYSATLQTFFVTVDGHDDYAAEAWVSGDIGETWSKEFDFYSQSLETAVDSIVCNTADGSVFVTTSPNAKIWKRSV